MNRIEVLSSVGIRGGIKSAWHSLRRTNRISSLILHPYVITDFSDKAVFDIKNRIIFGVHDRGATHPKLCRSKFSVGPEGVVRHTGSRSARIGAGTVLHVEGTFSMGDSYINSDARIICGKRISIGDNVSISWDVTLLDDDRHDITIQDSTSRRQAAIEIGDDVLIGHNSSIKKGVTINNGAVIASNSVVTSDVPRNSLVGGNPAQVIESGVSWN